MAKIRDAYGNTSLSGYAIDFFELGGVGAKNAYLASPFFTTFKPIEALTKRGCEVQLLVRLCSITFPTVLRKALEDPLVTVRYFTSRSFHAKLYIVDDIAMIGSANLTDAGLQTNREVSVVLRKDRDAGFESLPPMFAAFWEAADTLNGEVLAQFEEAFKAIGKPVEDAQFQAHLEKFVAPAIPPSAKVGSEVMSKRRSFVQSLRRKYDEQLNPAFKEFQAVFEQHGKRRPEFAAGDAEIEVGRLLGWLRIKFAPKDTWQEVALLDAPARKNRAIQFIEEWVGVADTREGDMFYADEELSNIAHLRTAFASPESIQALTYDELFDALVNVHAFFDRLRFVKGGLKGLRVQFKADNELSRIKETVNYLIHGPGTSLDRAYDCINDESRYLAGFGEHCVMELLGWMDPTRPPINGRTIKALRFLGFDVKE